MSDILTTIKNKTDEQLLDDIGLGKDSFREDIYELYLKEAENRGLDVSEEKILKITETSNQKSSEQDAKKYFILGVILLFVIFGLFAFIPGSILLKKDQSGNLIYKGHYKKFARFIVTWSIIAWGIIITGVIISILQ